MSDDLHWGVMENLPMQVASFPPIEPSTDPYLELQIQCRTLDGRVHEVTRIDQSVERFWSGQGVKIEVDLGGDPVSNPLGSRDNRIRKWMARGRFAQHGLVLGLRVDEETIPNIGQ